MNPLMKVFLKGERDFISNRSAKIDAIVTDVKALNQRHPCLNGFLLTEQLFPTFVAAALFGIIILIRGDLKLKRPRIYYAPKTKYIFSCLLIIRPHGAVTNQGAESAVNSADQSSQGVDPTRPIRITRRTAFNLQPYRIIYPLLNF